MASYYNEIDPYAAQWLRNLIEAGHIAPGIVDERSIEDVRPSDLAGFTQCHFFAGVGVWSLALRRAGWPDDRPVWTGSCPCQPFSAAGAGAGFDDQRHLWPHFHWLIEQCRPAKLLGEQVASKDAEPWIDLVQDDLEALGYAVGAVPFPSAGVGAPHIRDRLYWVANAASGGRREELSHARRRAVGDRTQGVAARLVHGRGAGWMADDLLQQRPEGQSRIGAEHDQAGRVEGAAAIAGLRNPGGLADLHGERCGEAGQGEFSSGRAQRAERRRHLGGMVIDADSGAGPTNGFWRDADWLACTDAKWRPVEPGTFPLAHGASSRVGRLRAYGNAINAIQAQVFIEAVTEA